MKINRATLQNGISKTFEDTVDFSTQQFDPTYIRQINSCQVKAKATDYEDLLVVEVNIKAAVIGVCSYSLEDVELNLDINDVLEFSDDQNDEQSYYEKGNIIELDEYILGIVLANIPPRIVKKGAKLPENGKNYRVMNEEEYERKKREERSSPFDVLDSVKISDD